MVGMVGNIGANAADFPYSFGTPRAQDSAAGSKKNEEITTVTVHCDKQHEHTRACPHTSSTRPANGVDGKGKYIDALV